MGFKLNLFIGFLAILLTISTLHGLENEVDFGTSKQLESDKARPVIREKRFLQSIKNLFKKKTTEIETTTTATTTTSTTAWVNNYRYTTTSWNRYFSSSIKPHAYNETLGDMANDPFYKLKRHCIATYDQMCSTKKKEIKDLVEKCDTLTKGKTAPVPDACQDILSIYCYVFSDDIYTCYMRDYPLYIPGKKKFTHSTTSPTTTASTQIYTFRPFTSYKPPSVWTIPIEVVTRPTTTTSTTTTKQTSSSYYYEPTTVRHTTKSNILNSPFGPGVITTIPSEPEKLKEIGQYCLKANGKDPNCDKALQMLKTKFKSCDKAPKSEEECQHFKMSFCTAFSNFPCCPDVLAGRKCSTKSRRALDLNKLMAVTY